MFQMPEGIHELQRAHARCERGYPRPCLLAVAVPHFVIGLGVPT